eukprot:TRINITY_DN13108_c0_g1_i4.p1 TRINITY_DN13108_c0_g1~~TRINITY_DN13108_c0_g1_i4.p1  ORF type:complete len:1100 (-),score=272.93 TRINITY_DN13108_c0_g1_i4:111-3344(-)
MASHGQTAANRRSRSAVVHGVGDDGDGVQQVKRPRSVKAPICAMCGVTSKGVPWAASVTKGGQTHADGDACQRCRQVWAAGFSYLSWEAACKVKAGYDSFLPIILFAEKVLKGEEKIAFQPQDVTDSRSIGYRVRKSLLAFTRVEFKQEFGLFLEQLFLRTQDMRDERGTLTKMVLVEDPSSRRYCDLQCNDTMVLNTFTQQASRVLHEKQGQATFDVNTASKFENLGKNFNTVDDIKASIERRARAQQSHEDVANSGSSDNEVERTIVLVGPVLSLANQQTKVLKHKDQKAKTTEDTPPRDGASVRSPAPSGRKGSSAGSPSVGAGFAFDSDIRSSNICSEMADAVLTRVPLASVLAGMKVKRTSKTLAHWVMKFKQKGLIVDADRIEIHEARVNAAETLYANVANMNQDELGTSLQILHGEKVDYPSEMKLALLEREVMDKAAVALHDPLEVKAFLGLIAPWTDVEQPIQFDEFNVRYAACEGSTTEKCTYFLATLVNHLISPLIKRGVEHAKTLVQVAKEVLDFVVDAAQMDIDEGYGETIVEVENMCRGLLFLAGEVVGINNSKIEHLLLLWDASSEGSSQTVAFQNLGAALHKTATWKHRVHALRQISATEASGTPTMSSTLGKLRSAFLSGDALAKACEELPRYKATIRLGAVELFENALLQGSRTVCVNFQACMDSSGDVDENMLKSFLSAHEAFTKFVGDWKDSGDAVLFARGYLSKRSFQDLAQSVYDACVAWSGGKLFSNSELEALNKAAASADGMDKNLFPMLGHENVKVACARLAKVALQPMTEQETCVEGAQVAIVLGQTLCKLSMDDGASKLYVDQLEVASTVRHLDAALKAWASMTLLPEETLSSKEKQDCMREIINSVSASSDGEVFDGAELDGTIYKEVLVRARDVITTTSTAVITNCKKKALKAAESLKPLRFGLKDGGRWTDHLEADDLESVKETAAQTLLKMSKEDVDILKSLTADMAKLLAEFGVVLMLFSKEDEDFDASTKIMKEAMATQTEALIFASLNMLANPIALRRALRQARSDAMESDYWDNISSVVRNEVDDLLKTRKVRRTNSNPKEP